MKKGDNIFTDLKNLFLILLLIIITKRTRKSLIEDNIITPFHEHITCKLRPHDYVMSYTNNSLVDYIGFKYHCKRCYKQITEEQYNFIIRIEKIKKLKKLSK